jgi:preprotein translocase subunit SecG
LSALLIVVLVIWLLSAIGMIVFVMLHSGKGTGLSDIIAGSFYGSTSGTSLVEKNLDRLTIICAIVFFLSLLALMVIYPAGTVSS